MTDEVTPVAVIGGGIAGAAACLRLKALGLNPTWYAPELGAEDRPGEHLAPAARALLARIDADQLLDRSHHREANSMLSAWGADQIAERNAIVSLEGPGTVVDRPAFERDLVDLALARDIRRVAGPVKTISRDGDGWRLVAEGGTERAGFVIDASGRAAVLARDQARRFRADQLAALVVFMDQNPASNVTPTRATLVEAVADGWWYASLLADGRLAVNYYTDPDLMPGDVTREPEVFRALIAETLYIGEWISDAEFRLERTPRLVSAGTTWLAPAAGAGWAAVGDAAVAFDPLSSHGMTTALWTAISAAEAAHGMLAGSDDGLRRYVGQVASGVQNFLDSRTRVYGAEQRFSDRQFWTRRHSTHDAEAMKSANAQ
jgi:flavin-dependent dehydrogenase